MVWCGYDGELLLSGMRGIACTMWQHLWRDLARHNVQRGVSVWHVCQDVQGHGHDEKWEVEVAVEQKGGGVQWKCLHEEADFALCEWNVLNGGCFEVVVWKNRKVAVGLAEEGKRRVGKAGFLLFSIKGVDSFSLKNQNSSKY